MTAVTQQNIKHDMSTSQLYKKKKGGVVFVISEMHFKSTDLPNILLSAEILPLDCTSFRYAAYKKIFR